MYSQSIVNFDYADESNFEKEMIMNKLAKLIAGVENRIRNRINHLSSIHQECETENRNLINDGYEFSIAKTLLEKHQQEMKDKIDKAKNELIAFQNDCVAYIENPLSHPVKQPPIKAEKKEEKDDRQGISLKEFGQMDPTNAKFAITGKYAKYKFDLLSAKKIVEYFGYTPGGKTYDEYSHDLIYDMLHLKEYHLIAAVRILRGKHLNNVAADQIVNNWHSIRFTK